MRTVNETTISALVDQCVVTYANLCGIDGPTEGWKNNLKSCLEPLASRLRAECILREASLGARDIAQDELASLPSRLAEAERKVAEWERDLASYREKWNAVAVENQRLAARVASLESDLSAVTASSVEHAKTIDGLRAELARAREALRNLANKAGGLRAFEGELRATCGNTNFSLLMDAVAVAAAAGAALQESKP